MSNKSKELKLCRVYDAPVAVVWDAWTDPKKAAQWWGPRGFTLTTHGKDLRPGGNWSYTMHGPDGVDYPNKTVYLEVEKQAKLVYDHGGNDDRPPLFRVTVFFIELLGKTRMDMTMTLPTPEAAEEIRKFIKKANGDSTWDRLAEYLEKQSKNRETFVINRSFEAPIDVLFEMWTDPKLFGKWLPPTGATMEFIRADIRPGGSTLYSMSYQGGMKLYGRASYQEISRPSRIVYTQQFCDEKGDVSRHPMAPTWPETLLTTVLLTEEEPGRTRVTVTWEPFGDTKSEELEAFVKARGGMTMGWSGSFDKLDDLIAAPSRSRPKAESR